MYVCVFPDYGRRKDIAERRRIKSLGRVIRLEGNGTLGRTSLHRIISPIVLSECRARKWTETNYEEEEIALTRVPVKELIQGSSCETREREREGEGG